MKFREKYKRELEKKVDSLMIFTSASELRYTKKDLIFLGIVGALLLGYAAHTCNKFYVSNDNLKFERMIYAMFFSGIVWELAYFGVGMLYTKTKKAFFKKVYIVLGYIGLIIGTFIGALLTLLELLSKRVNIYHLYKYFYAVMLALLYTIIMVMIFWNVIVLAEHCLPDKFILIDWTFGIWILLYILFRFSFWICLKMWFKFLWIDSKVIKVVSDEMQIPLYILLVICMTIIWGVDALNYSKNDWMIGFLNASTVIVLFGSLRDKIGNESDILSVD